MKSDTPQLDADQHRIVSALVDAMRSMPGVAAVVLPSLP